MPNSYFQFKQFIVHQDRCAMKVTTDGCLFGAWAAERVRSQEPGAVSILDVGTGSGLLSLMMAQKTNAFIDAIEIEKDSFEQASLNIIASPWAERIKVYHADARQFSFPHQYDVIISNPPFYENELKSDNEKKNLAHHNEGLLLSELITIIKKNLAPGGSFYLLLPFKRNDEIRDILTGNGLAADQIIFVRPTVHNSYFRLLVGGRLQAVNQVETMINEISITDEKRHYTSAFKELLEEFYLYL